jgi:hypothetical protein
VLYFVDTIAHCPELQSLGWDVAVVCAGSNSVGAARKLACSLAAVSMHAAQPYLYFHAPTRRAAAVCKVPVATWQQQHASTVCCKCGASFVWLDAAGRPDSSPRRLGDCMRQSWLSHVPALGFQTLDMSYTLRVYDMSVHCVGWGFQ